MACHNERVARSRKHAEAKRSRTVRKEKEARSGRREREKSNLSTTNGTNGSGSFDMADLNAIPTAASVDFDTRPVPPPHSPLPTASSSMSAINSNSVSPYTIPSALPNSRPRTSPQDGRHSSDDNFLPSEHAHHTHSDSKQSISSLGKGTTPLSINVPNYRNIQETGRATSDPQEVGSGWDSRNSGDGREPRRRSLSRPPLRTSDSHPPPPRSASATSPLSPSFSPRNSSSSATYDKTSSRQGSLSAPAPTDKGANRRSGFYGAMARAAAAEASSSTEGESKGTSIGRQSPVSDQVTETSFLPSRAITPPPPETPSKPASFLPELHKSMSFYDPDTLLFLDHVGSDGGRSPKTQSLSRRSQSYKAGVSNMGSVDQIERLTPDLDDSSEEDGTRRVRRESDKSEISRKIRESIRRSKGDGNEMGMDVDLVEMLLGELDGTKNEMQDLQSKYNAFRVRTFDHLIIRFLILFS